MARPRKSERDTWIDCFANWPADEREVALDLAACVHRHTKRWEDYNELYKAKPESKISGKATGKTGARPAGSLLDSQPETEAIR